MLADVYFVLILIVFITSNILYTLFFKNFMILIYPKKCEKSNESKKKVVKQHTLLLMPVAAKQISRYFKYI